MSELHQCKEEIDKAISSFNRLFQDKQTELLLLEQQIQQAKDELAGRQAAVMMVSPEVPRDIRTEIFSHINNNKTNESEPPCIMIKLGERTKQFTIALLVKQKVVLYFIKLAKYIDEHSLQEAIRDNIDKLSSTFTIIFGCTSMRVYNRETEIPIYSEKSDYTSGAITLPYGRKDMITCLTKVLTALPNCLNLSSEVINTMHITADGTDAIDYSLDDEYKKYFLRVDL